MIIFYGFHCSVSTVGYIMEQFRPVELWEERLESACGNRKSVASHKENAFFGFDSSVVSTSSSSFSMKGVDGAIISS